METDRAIDGYYRFHAQRVLGGSAPMGISEGWAAPVAVFDASHGFGEDAWTDAIPLTVVATRLHGARVTWCCGKHSGRVSGPSATVLQPKGTPNHSRAGDAVRFSQIYLPDLLIDRVADAIRPGATISGMLRDDLIFMPDPAFDAQINDYLRAARSGASALEMEAAAILMIGHLLRAHHGFAEARPSRGGLAPWQLKRAREAVEAHLGEDIGLDELAAVVGCSPTHFSRAFKQSTGIAPFQWLLERRIERAKDLLAQGGTSLAEVALAVGFAAQPQFTTAFKRATGTTPGAWRRERAT